MKENSVCLITFYYKLRSFYLKDTIDYKSTVRYKYYFHKKSIHRWAVYYDRTGAIIRLMCITDQYYDNKYFYQSKIFHSNLQKLFNIVRQTVPTLGTAVETLDHALYVLDVVLRLDLDGHPRAGQLGTGAEVQRGW